MEGGSIDLTVPLGRRLAKLGFWTLYPYLPLAFFGNLVQNFKLTGLESSGF